MAVFFTSSVDYDPDNERILSSCDSSNVSEDIDVQFYQLQENNKLLKDENKSLKERVKHLESSPVSVITSIAGTSSISPEMVAKMFTLSHFQLTQLILQVLQRLNSPQILESVATPDSEKAQLQARVRQLEEELTAVKQHAKETEQKYKAVTERAQQDLAQRSLNADSRKAQLVARLAGLSK